MPVSDPAQDVLEVGLRVQTVELCRDDKRIDGCRPLAAAIRPCKEIVLAPDCDFAHRVLGDVVVCALIRRIVLPGGNPGRQTLAPAGSTRGGSGGDEWPEAPREKSPVGGQRTVRAAT